MSANLDAALLHSWVMNAGAWTIAVRDRLIESRSSVTDSAIVAAIGPRIGMRVLDLGCGEGWLSRLLSKAGCDVVGIDGSEPMIEHARELNAATFITLDYESFAAVDRVVLAQFDCVVCNFSLLIQDVSQLLSSLRRMLTPKGRLIIQAVHPATMNERPLESGWRSQTFDFLAPLKFEPMVWFYRTPQTWLAELNDSGWSVDDLAEPSDPQTGNPISLILSATPLGELTGGGP